MAKHKCFNGLSEFYIDCDGRGLHCAMGKEGASHHSDFVQKYGHDPKKLFRSSSVRELRKNCKGCRVKCFCYAFPKRDSLLSISRDILKLNLQLLKVRLKTRR
jgi:radical SAM protein with 4Fe4S-binding SPASM domain